MWFNASGDEAKRKVVVNGDINDIRGAVDEAKRKGVINESQAGRADPEIRNAIRLLTPTPENPDPGKLQHNFPF